MSSKTQNSSQNKKIEHLSELLNFKKPTNGWINTARNALGMTLAEFAKKINVSQPRVAEMEKNETNLKLSTMQKIADALDFEFVYVFVPKRNLEEIKYNQAKKKAEKILKIINQNMTLEDKRILNKTLLDFITKDFLSDKNMKIWDVD